MGASDRSDEELPAAAGRAQRRRRARTRQSIGALVAAAALLVGVVACTRNDEQASNASTETPVDSLGPAAAQAETCNRFLDLQTGAPPTGPALAAALDGMVTSARASGDRTLASIAAAYRDSYPTAEGEVSSQRAVDAYNDLVAHCRAIHLPGLNPVYIRATVGPPPGVDLGAYGDEQILEPSGGALPVGAGPPQGRDLGPVEVAVSAEGGYVMTWRYNQGPGDPRTCIAHGTARTGSRSCGLPGDPKSLPPTGISILSSGGNVGDPSVSIGVSSTTAFVALDAAGQRFVEQPVAGITIFVWQLAGSATRLDFTARAYDADGRALGCVASGAGTC